jgi:hypothetical protein
MERMDDVELFLIEGYGLCAMTWEDAMKYETPRIKTSLAITRARVRRAMEVTP